jgi:hypothetical protein
MGLLTTFTLFIAPFLHVKWDVWMWEVTPPSDWREWVGRMALINVVALGAYQCSRRFFSHCFVIRRSSYIWQPDKRHFWVVGILLFGVTALLQLWVFHQHGGILAYIADYQNPDAHYKFDGMGPLYMVSESFPVVFALLFLVFMAKRPIKHSWFIWAVFLLLIFVLRLLCGGLRGSRLAIVLTLFWMTGAIHIMIRPIPKRLFAVGAVCTLAFMYLFLTYKDGGDVDKLFSTEERLRLQQIHHRSFEGVLLGDLGRTDVHAYLLYKLMSDPEQFTYARGDTYRYAASLLIPRRVLPNRPIDKTIYGADLLYGPGSYVPDVYWSSRIYGLAGESMLNFSPLSIPLAFVFLGFIVAVVRSIIWSFQPGDLRLFLAPLAVYMCLWIYTADSDNVLFQLVAYGFVPSCFILASARRVPCVCISRTSSPGPDRDSSMTDLVTPQRKMFTTITFS